MSKHQWLQASNIPKRDNSGRLYTLFRCDRCDLEYKRRGKKWEPPKADCKAKPKEAKLAKIVKYKASKEEATTRTEHIRELYQKMGNTWWELGEQIEKAVSDRVPEALGQSFSAWAEGIFGDSWLRIRRAFLAVKATKQIPHEKRVQISEGNAYHFAHLPEKERKSPEWLKKAIDLDNEEFKAATEKFIEKRTGIRDPMIKITDALGFVTVPKSFFEIVKETMKLAAEVHNADLKTKQGCIDCCEAIFSDYITTNGAAVQDYLEVEGKPEITD